MGTLLFGDDDHIDCIEDITLQIKPGEDLCLAHRTTLHFVGAGIYLTDHGYVLKVKTSGSDGYYPLTEKQIGELQAEHSLPTPLPAYDVSFFQYLFGYSLWIVLAGVAVAMFVQHKRRKAREAEDALTATTFGPPPLETAADRYLDEQVRPLLREGETVMHQAFTFNQDPTESITATSRYAALTSARRFVFVTARMGVTGPCLENKGVEVVEAAEVAGVHVDDRTIVVTLHDGTARVLWVSPTKKMSSQRAFLRDVPRILRGESPPGTTAAPAPVTAL